MIKDLKVAGVACSIALLVAWFSTPQLMPQTTAAGACSAGVLCMDVRGKQISTTAWVLPFVPSQLAVYRNGVRQKFKEDYTLIGSTVIVSPPLDPDDLMTFDLVR